jgi:hypothetical protein
MNLPVKITKIEISGGACPYQIEGYTENGDYFYLRYRGGRLRAGVAKNHNEFWQRDWSVSSPYNIIDIQYGHPLAGCCNEEEHRPLLEGKIIFPEGFKMDTAHYQEPEYDEPTGSEEQPI